MMSLVQAIKMLILVINTYLFITAKGDNEHLSNYTNAKVNCHNRGGLLTQKSLKFDGLINITCKLDVNNDVLKDGESVWIQGKAQTGPYIALQTCLRYSNQSKEKFARIKTFNSNILYECSVFCDKIILSIGYLGIYKNSCLCTDDSLRFPQNPECLDDDFLDRHNGIIVFKLIRKLQFDIQSKSANFNCIGASVQKGRTVSYYNTKCVSSLYSICSERVDSELSNKCLPKQEGFCINKENNTFLEHYRKCWLYNGTLIPFIPGKNVYLNYSVMLGSFRAFKAIEDDGKHKANVTWSCLSITQFNGTIYLETENCSNENVFYCMDNINQTSGTEANETTDGVLTYSVPIVIVIYILIPTVTVIGVAITITIVIRWRCRRRRKSRGTSQNDTPQQPDETGNGNPLAEMIEEELPLYAESTISEADNNPSQYLPEEQQSINIYNHLQIWQDEDDDTYDMTRFHNA